MRSRYRAKAIHWLVLRNQLGTQQMQNMHKVGGALVSLSQRAGFASPPLIQVHSLFSRRLSLLELRNGGREHLAFHRSRCDRSRAT